ncbi:MAG: PAS domain S-box protein [Ignavibacteriales bacterium]|nr:MAG: PAS domain S-box protein [Ignavibacteriales bacterium]
MNSVFDAGNTAEDVHLNNNKAEFGEMPLFRYHPSPMLIIDINSFNVIDSNLAATTLYGFTSLEFKNLNIFSLLPDPGEFIRTRSDYTNSQLLDEFELAVDHISKTGYKLSVITHSVAVSNENNNHRCIIINDTTDYFELKKAFSFRNILEENIQSISTKFIGIESQYLDKEIEGALKIIGELMEADRSYLFLLSGDEKFFTNTHEWCSEGISPQIQILQNLPIDDFKWFFDSVRTNEYLYIPESGSIPSDAENVREILKAQEIKSLFAVPLVLDKKFIGFCGFDFVRQNKFWDKSLIKMLRSIGLIISNALERKQRNEKNTVLNQALRESESKFRNVIDQSADGVFITDEEGTIIEWNKKLVEMTELDKSSVISKKLWDIHFQFAPYTRTADGEKLRLSLAKELLSGSTIMNEKFVEEQYQLSSGKIIDIEWMLFPIKTSKGFIIAGIVHDLTDKKRNAEQLKIFSRAIETTTSAVVLSDLNGNIVYVNKALIDLGRFVLAEEVIGRQLTEFTDQNGQILLKQEIIPTLLEGKSWKGELTAIANDGTLIFTDMQCSLINDDDNRPLYLLAVLLDITARKQMEEALIQNEQKYRSVVESVKEVIFQTDAQGLWTYLNPAWEEITGFKVDESIGELFLNYVHPDDRQRNAEYFAPLIQRKKPYCRHIVRYLTKSGSFRHIEVFARLTLNKDDEIIGTSGTLNDVTDRLKSEEDIMSNLAREKELGELKSRFVSMVSHEFRTPLTSILASTELLLRYHTKWNDAKKLETTERVFRSAEYMNELVNDVLTLNRVESGKLSYNPAPMDMVQFCKNAIDELRVLALPSHKISFINEPEKINGTYDEKLLKHVLHNLISNAFKYSPSGGDVVISLLKKHDKIFMSVRDEGIGISKEDQQRLFEPFFRGKNIGNISGTGLGLSILKKSIEMHNGSIEFKSEVNKGTEFTIILPVTD